VGKRALASANIMECQNLEKVGGRQDAPPYHGQRGKHPLRDLGVRNKAFKKKEGKVSGVGGGLPEKEKQTRLWKKKAGEE